jgi:hypothetical protein
MGAGGLSCLERSHVGTDGRRNVWSGGADVIKRLTMWHAKQGVPPDEALDYWNADHAELVRGCLGYAGTCSIIASPARRDGGSLTRG